MTVTSAADRRAAAQIRRKAADAERHARGDIAYKHFRSAAPGIGVARQVPMKTVVRAQTEMRNGKELIHTFGFFTRYDMPYPMWDMYGEYDETVKRGAGARTLASNPDVAWLVNHKGVTMARTTNGTLELEERDEGGWHDAWLNPARQDVKDIVIAIEDRSVDQMSFAFIIPDDGGWWSEDFERFDIGAYDIDRGDVSAVNYGASPWTDISARTAEVLNDLEHLPAGALTEASARLARRGVPQRERVQLREAATVREQRGPRPAPGAYRARLRSRIDRTVDRFQRIAFNRGGAVPDLSALRNTPLPWYEIRSGIADDPHEDGVTQELTGDDDTATIFVFDEIGGSMGVNAKEFAADLEQITAPNIKLRINSPGGSVFDGIAIHSALLHHPARVTAYVDGLAASAASFIAMAGDEIVMMPGSQLMIHDASATVDGNADDMARFVTFLDRQSDNIADMYMRVGGGTREEWRELMLDETWMFADEAVQMGLADRVEQVERRRPPTEVEERMARKHDLRKFAYRFESRSAAPRPQRRTAAGRPPLGAAVTPGREWQDDFSDMVKAGERLASNDAAEQSRDADGYLRLQGTARGDSRVDPLPATQDQPKGRSIALIEAQLAID
jgi:HK97 family phage prohead protease